MKVGHDERLPFSFSKLPAAARAAWASRGRDVSTTDAVMVSGRSASWSSSGMGAGSADTDRCGMDAILCFANYV
jgi:hypothetical protein